MLELGNFDSFYDQGITFSADDVLDMAKETRELFPLTCPFRSLCRTL